MKDKNIIISKLLNIPYHKVLVGDFYINENEKEKINEMIARRNEGEPIAYLFQEKSFYGRNFFVDKNVLVPRPETEFIIDFLRDKIDKKDKIVDIGTGSGCIGLTIILEFDCDDVELVEPSKEAILVAKKNKDLLKIKKNISFNNDFFPACDFDILVSNPPYLTQNEYDKNKEELCFEPFEALVADDDGMKIIEEIIKFGFTKNPRMMILEMSTWQAEKMKKKYGGYFLPIYNTNVSIWVYEKNNNLY